MKVKVTVGLPHDDLEWLKSEYGDGQVSWVLTMLLHNFRSIHDDTGVTPRKVARDSAKEFREAINEGMFEK